MPSASPLIRLFAVGVLSVFGALPLGARLARAQPAGSEVAQERARREVERGERLLVRGRRRAAEGAFTRAMRLDPSAPLPITRLAELWLGSLGEITAHPTAATMRRASQVLAAVANVPDGVRRERMQLTEAMALAATGDHAGAVAVLARAPRLVSGQLGTALDALALLCAERHDLASAETALRVAIEGAPEAERARRLGDVLLARGRAAQAVTVLQTALGFAPDALGLRVALAEAQLAAGDTEGAAAGLTLVATRCPFECGALLARIALESGDATLAAQRAREVLERPVTAGSPSPDAVADADGELAARASSGYVLGLALLRLGRREDARNALRDVLRRAPDHAGARRALRATMP
ncbi:MAG: tetratricopeptide repeat protein [Polyangiales bacterium]|nr:tetratricopeptide repeat protein [Myxococcales bacterium]MCB9658955.1 tetratricopeptide repeat protein [Sandaracinaceae bacterium]